jgi:TolA-binding protein
MNATLHTPTSHNPHTTDFRDNVRRQASEQKSIGRILTLISISFATLIIASFALAGYGGYVMWNRLNEQSSTLVDVENKFNSRISTLQSSIDRLQIELHRTQKYSDELTRQNQELTRALREQQEMARRTKAQVDTLVNQIRQEKILRDQQFASLSRDLNRNSAPRALPSVPNTQAARQADRFPSSTPLSPVRR